MSIDPWEKFPDLRPINRAPLLGTVNGVGFNMYGVRDRDELTQTYITTRCFCFVFIPLIPIGSYRVASARGGGWYILGKEPMSVFARFWNMLLVSAILIGGSIGYWNSYIKSPDYIAQKKLEQAEQKITEGGFSDAARLFNEVALGPSIKTHAAAERLKSMIQGPLKNAPLDEILATLEITASLRRQGRINVKDEWLTSWMLELAERHQKDAPQKVLKLFDIAFEDSGPPSEKVTEIRVSLLEQLVKQQPKNVNLATQLALAYEAKGEFEKCEPLLMPHVELLGSEQQAATEGARILGQALARKGDFENSYKLLNAYAKQRLPELHAAEKSFKTSMDSAQRRVFDDLNNGKGPASFYSRYRSATKSEQERIVDQYVSDKLKNHPAINDARAKLRKAAAVVPVALDLGIVTLRRAQNNEDAEARKSELKKAEETFLAIQGVAGQSDEYRLYLGQVYYWLGKAEEGHKLFDELLAAKQRDHQTLITVATSLREVGEITEFRSLAEEAYNATADLEEKQNAALLRSLNVQDDDERIEWLKRANQSNWQVRASLANAQGEKAIEAGDDAKAVEHLNEAISIYNAQPATAATLNNASLSQLSLVRISGDVAALNQANENLEKALALTPRDSIVTLNLGATLISASIADVVGDKLDFKTLKQFPDERVLAYLYPDGETRDQYHERFLNDPKIAKALECVEKGLVLAPKRPHPYSILHSLYRKSEDEAKVKDLLKRLEAVELDFVKDKEEEEGDEEAKKAKQAEEDAESIATIKLNIQRYQAIVEATRSARDANHVVALGHLLAQRTSLQFYDKSVSCDELVALAEEAHQLLPSDATFSNLYLALLTRVGTGLIEESPEYAKLYEDYKSKLSHIYLMPVGLEYSEELREKILANKDFQRSMDLMLDEFKAFKDSRSPWGWALMRFARPEEAKKITAIMQAEKLRYTNLKISRLLSPKSSTVAYDWYWNLLIDGKTEEARKVLKEFADQGAGVFLFDLAKGEEAEDKEAFHPLDESTTFVALHKPAGARGDRLTTQPVTEDWPRWRGPRGDGSWNAPELAKNWPKDGLKAVWRRPIGAGYSGIAVVDNRVYTMDRPPKTDVENVHCFDASNGKLLWTHRYDAIYGKLSYGKGPRTTPTVHDGRVYTLGAVGHLHCLDANDGKVIWSKDLKADHKAHQPEWGFSSSPIIHENKVIVHAGLKPNGCYAAFDLATGKEIWRGGDDPTGYGTPIIIRQGDAELLVGWTPENIIGLTLDDGKVAWKIPYKVTYGVSIATPIFREQTVLVCGYWEGSKAIRLDDSLRKATLAWEENRYLRGLMAQPLYRDGHVYLLDKSQGLVCFELATNKVIWNDKNQMTPRGRNPQATMVWIGDSDRALVLSSAGELLQVQLTPAGYKELGRTKVVGETWAHPAYAGRFLFARDDSEIVCIELP